MPLFTANKKFTLTAVSVMVVACALIAWVVTSLLPHPRAEIQWFAPGLGKVTNTGTVPLTDLTIAAPVTTLQRQGGFTLGTEQGLIYADFNASTWREIDETGHPGLVLHRPMQPGGRTITLQPGGTCDFILQGGSTVFPPPLVVRLEDGASVEVAHKLPPPGY